MFDVLKYVTNKSSAGFEAHELGGGQSNVAFDYRIVALRRGYENVRLADVSEAISKIRVGMPKPATMPKSRLPHTAVPAVPGVAVEERLAASGKGVQRSF